MYKILGIFLPVLIAGGIFFASCEGYDLKPDFAPSVSLVSPADGDTFAVSDTILFKCTASDPEDGDLDGQSVIWTSDKDGVLGYGIEFEKSGLSSNTHSIELMAVDSLNNYFKVNFTLHVQ